MTQRQLYSTSFDMIVTWPLVECKQEEDTDSVIALVERAILAQTDATPGHRPWSAETHTTRRNPKRFALAEVRVSGHAGTHGSNDL